MGVLEAAQLVNFFIAKISFSMHTFLLYMSGENNLVFFMFKKKMKSSNIQMHKIDTSNYNDWIDILFNTLIVTAFGFWIKPSFDIIWRMSKTETNKTLQIHWIIIVTDVIEHCLLLCFKKNQMTCYKIKIVLTSLVSNAIFFTITHYSLAQIYWYLYFLYT